MPLSMVEDGWGNIFEINYRINLSRSRKIKFYLFRSNFFRILAVSSEIIDYT